MTCEAELKRKARYSFSYLLTGDVLAHRVDKVRYLLLW